MITPIREKGHLFTARPLAAGPSVMKEALMERVMKVCLMMLLVTAPVASPSLAGESIFSDGFESGDATAWSVVYPIRPLLFSEIVVTDNDAEFFEIANPNPIPISLEEIYVADYDQYYLITIGSGAPGLGDFRVRFPDSTSIGAHDVVVVSLHSASVFHTNYAAYPDFDLDSADANAPALPGELNSQTLSNGNEMLLLFEWDGYSDLVKDHDYFLWGDTTNAMDKSGAVVGTSVYLPETAVGLQVPGQAPPLGSSLLRVDFNEGTETTAGSNGATGHDETSENLSTTTQVSSPPTPGS